MIQGWCFVQEAQHHTLEWPGDETNRLQIIMHKKVRMLPDGRPVLQVLLLTAHPTMRHCSSALGMQFDRSPFIHLFSQLNPPRVNLHVQPADR